MGGEFTYQNGTIGFDPQPGSLKPNGGSLHYPPKQTPMGLSLCWVVKKWNPAHAKLPRCKEGHVGQPRPHRSTKPNTHTHTYPHPHAHTCMQSRTCTRSHNHTHSNTDTAMPTYTQHSHILYTQTPSDKQTGAPRHAN